MGHEIKRGSLATGRKTLSENTGLSEQSIRTSLDRLKSTSELTIISTSKFSIITLCNYDKYQSEENKINQQNVEPLTSIQPAFNQHSTTIKECKNDKNERKCFIKPTAQEISNYCIEIGYSLNAQSFLDSNEAKGWVVGKNRTPIKDWKAVIRTWRNNETKQNDDRFKTAQIKTSPRPY